MFPTLLPRGAYALLQRMFPGGQIAGEVFGANQLRRPRWENRDDFS